MRIIPVDHEILASVNITDKRNHPALVDGPPVCISSNPEVIEVIPTDSPFSFLIRSAGILGTSQITIQADADLSEGERIIFATDTIEVIGGEAANVGIVFGDATPVPEEPIIEPETEPTPVDPAPVDPTPVDPTPVDPTPVDPAPVDPAPVDPVPATDPTPVDPTPVDPTTEEPTT